MRWGMGFGGIGCWDYGVGRWGYQPGRTRLFRLRYMLIQPFNHFSTSKKRGARSGETSLFAFELDAASPLHARMTGVVPLCRRPAPRMPRASIFDRGFLLPVGASHDG